MGVHREATKEFSASVKLRDGNKDPCGDGNERINWIIQLSNDKRESVRTDAPN